MFMDEMIDRVRRMINLRKIFLLPTVIDLGWSKTNALPMRKFSKEIDGPTWEDYHELMKKDYPVRYFLCKTLVNFVHFNFLMPLDNFRWYVKAYWLKKIHMLDLRQQTWVEGCDEYRWGYLDTRSEILYACMNSLDRFIQESDAKTRLSWLRSELGRRKPEDEDFAVFKDSVELYQTAIEIHKWWNIDRKSDYIRLSRMDDYRTPEASRASFDRWNSFEEKEDEMLAKLMKIRRGLQT